MRRGAGAIALLLSLVAKAGAAPSPADEAARAAEAKKLCAAGQVAGGVAILAELFTSTGDLDYVYNQGRCYQQNSRPDEAISRFREYLRRAKGITREDRGEVETFIKELEAERDESARRRAAAAPAAPPAATINQPQTAPAPAPGPDGRSVGKGSLAAGGALVVAGSVCWLIANGKYAALKDDCNHHDCTLSRYDAGTSSVKTWDTVAGVSLIGGAIGLLGGAALYLWSPAHPGAERPVEAFIDPWSRTASLKGRF